VSNIPKFVN